MEKRNSLGPGIVIGIPTLGRPVSLDWALAFKALNPPINFNVNFVLVKNQQVADARNAIVRQAMTVDAKYLFFLGDDTIPPPHALRQLIFRMENQLVDVVGGVYCAKCDPAAPLVFMEDGKGSYWDWKVGEFFQCNGLGADCLLIRVELLKKLSEPWFKTVDTDQYLDGKNAAEMWTEDLWFFRKLREELGIQPWCDASVICEHVDVYSGKVYTLPKDSLPMRLKVVSREKRCLMLGPSIELNDDSFDITTIGIDGDYRAELDNLPFDENQFDWVIVSQPLDSYNHTIFKELLRVAKGKISVNMQQIVHRPALASLLRYNHGIEMEEDGSFITVNKNVISIDNSLGS